MKTIACLATIGLLTGFASLPLLAQDQVLAKSPDHPKTWVTGATKSFLALRYDHQKQMLVADVTYSTGPWADDVHPTQKEDYTITFPGVRFNPESNTFTANGVTVAKLHHLIIGDDITLEKGAALSVHRHNGLVFGSIVTARNA